MAIMVENSYTPLRGEYNSRSAANSKANSLRKMGMKIRVGKLGRHYRLYARLG